MSSGSVLDEFARSIDVGALSSDQFVRLLETLHMLDTAGAGVTVHALSTEVLAGIVADASREQITALAAHPELRRLFLEEIFHRMRDHFVPAKAKDADIVVSWRFPNGDDDFDRFQTVIEGGACSSTADNALTPDTTITMAADDFFRLATGNARPTSLLMTGRLKLKGDYTPALRMLGCFDIPKR